MITFGKPIIEYKEHEKIKEVLDSGIFVHGEMTENFENFFSDIFGYKYSSSVANCTAGLHLAHYSLTKNIDSDKRHTKEVICPAMSHVATAHAIELAGMKPRFVDCNFEDGNINIDGVRKAINKNTIGIAPMHFNGVPCQIENIIDLAKEFNLYVIEDCAIALGAKVNGKPVGSFGDAGAFSFHPVKQLTTGEGGMVVTNNSSLHNELLLEKAFGVNRTFNERKVPGQYDVTLLGFNYRMAEIPAAIGIAQLEKYKSFAKTRKENYFTLRESLIKESKIRILADDVRDGRSYYTLIAQFKDLKKSQRNELIMSLKKSGIQTSVYYPHPIPRFKYYKNKLGYSSILFPNSEMIADQTIAFPIAPHLNKNDMLKISRELNKLI
tara:strand:+ start:94 stop:1236 length:1143 start_codon:yes stop_codon:yes gene_type:complete